MKKEIIVISLGGSIIIPDKINQNVLRDFKKIINKNKSRYKFIIVCGGGSIARKYIFSLEKENASIELQSMAGISATRMNARFMSYFFNKDQKKGIPHTILTLENYIKKSEVVFCGALDYKPEQTSDTTSAIIANHFNSRFINLTNIDGLYDKNPLKYKNARFIPKISWKDFYEIANKIKFKPGQNFILDQKSSYIIMKNKIKTYILGSDMKNLDNFLNNKKGDYGTISNKSK